MAEVTKDLIKFVVEILLLLLVFSVVFNPERGIIGGVFNYLAYSEPILLQHHISSAIAVASDMEGDFRTEIKTSGYPYEIEVYTTDKTFISVKPVEDELMGTRFFGLEPSTAMSKCYIPDQKIILKKGIASTIHITKESLPGLCNVYVSVPTTTD